MALSIVSTLYKSENYLDEFVSRCRPLIGTDGEIVLVDDGSPDQSFVRACELARLDPRIIVIKLSRNFGHHHAILAGLANSRFERVLLVDSDLEEAPELHLQFEKLMDATGADVIFGIHNHSQGSFIRKATSKFFWKAFNWASDSNTPLNICNIRLMKRAYVDVLCSLPERNIFLGGLFYWVGFTQIAVPVQRTIRREQSTYSITSRLKLAVRSIVAFSTAPLKAMFWLGCSISITSILVALHYTITKLMDPDILLGFTTLIISVWFLGGLIIACLGVIGIYVAAMYMETKSRPRFIISEIYRARDL